MKKIILGLILATISINIYADTSSQNLNPSLTILGSCNIDTTNLVVNFGSMSFGSTASVNLPSSTLSVTCLTGLPYSVGFDAGLHWQTGTRYMQHNPATGDDSDNIGYMLTSTISGNDIGDDNLDVGLPSPPPYSVTTAGTNGLTGFTGDGLVNDIAVTAIATLNTGNANRPTGVYRDTVHVIVLW